MSRNLRTRLQELTADNTRSYSEMAVVMQTNKEDEQIARGETYDPYKHIVCDVRLVRDGSMVYDVRLTPHILATDSAGNVTEVVYDGSKNSKTGDVYVRVPRVSSYVYISYLNEEDAFVSLMSNSESNIVGTGDGAYIDFYTADERKIVELFNTDEFRIELNDGYLMVLDSASGTLLFQMRVIDLLTSGGANLRLEEDADLVTSTGKIEISNDSENLKDILLALIGAFKSYVIGVTPALTAAGVPPSPTLVPDLGKLETRVRALFK